MTVHIKHLLPGSDLADAHFVRAEVFQKEMGISGVEDFDDLDVICGHYVAYDAGAPVGTARYRLIEDGSVKVERVAVLATMRGRNIGLEIMRAIEQEAWRQGVALICLDAQLTAAGFYDTLGYDRIGEVFEEIGIPHIKMTLQLRAPIAD